MRDDLSTLDYAKFVGLVVSVSVSWMTTSGGGK